jgi:transcription elongation factor Elf1
MDAEYKCISCGISSKITYDIQEGPGKPICSHCGGSMTKVWKALSTNVPDYFNDDLHNTITSKMKNAGMPSGKTKVLH